MTHKAELTPENIKNPQFEGVFTMRLNGEYFMANMDERAEKLAFIAKHNPLTKPKCGHTFTYNPTKIITIE
jgi:hypothetical protein